MKKTRISTLVWVMAFVSVANSATIDFEPTATDTFEDNIVFPAGTVGGVTYRFGVDVDADGLIDFPARLEQRGSDSINAYTLGSVEDDADLDTSVSGGEWLLRRPKITEEGATNNLDVAMVWELATKSLQPLSSVGGQIWDVDLGEEFLITLTRPSGDLIQSLTLPVGTAEGRGSATSFQFDELNDATSVKLSVRLLSAGQNAGGYGIDNVTFTLVPEPAWPSYVFLLFTSAMLHCGRVRVRNYRHMTFAAKTPQ